MFPSSPPPPNLFAEESAEAPPLDDDAPVVSATPGERRFVRVWTTMLCVVAMVVLVLLVLEQRNLVAHARESERDLLRSSSIGTRAGERGALPLVTVGLYVDRVTAFSLVDSTWQPEFYIWFSSSTSDLEPGEKFQVHDGKIVSRTLVKKLDESGRHYALYRVSALITQTFDISRFPRDAQTLMLTIDGTSTTDHPFAFVADKTAPALSSRVFIPGYAVDGVQSVVRPAQDEPTLGDRNAFARPPTSQLAVQITISHPTWRLFVQSFGPAYLAMGLAFLGFLLRGASDRVWIGATALSMLLMNTRAIGALAPSTNARTLADTLSAIGYVSLTLLVLQSVLVTTFFGSKARRDAARIFDRSTILVLAAVYVIVNVGIVLAASA